MNEKFKTFPWIIPIKKSNSLIKCRFKKSKLIGENYIACLIDKNEKLIWGKFLSVDAVSETCEFKLNDESESSILSSNETMWYLDSYWGERVEIILNKQKGWEQRKFQNSDAIDLGGSIIKAQEKEVQDKSNIIRKGWNHEHCLICWETISEDSDFGYRNQDDDWLCLNCYRQYYERDNFDFIDSDCL